MASSLYLKFLHAGATTAAVIVAFLLRQILVWNLGFHLGPFVTYYSAIMVIALVFGLRAGLAATLLAALLDVYWVLPPIKKFSVAKEDDVVELVLFIATGIFMSAVSDRYVRERKMLDTALASMQDALFIYDAQGKLIKFNQSFIRLLKCRSTNDCPRACYELGLRSLKS
jgi:K+-sensing histidine kinase KdpD